MPTFKEMLCLWGIPFRTPPQTPSSEGSAFATSAEFFEGARRRGKRILGEVVGLARGKIEKGRASSKQWSAAHFLSEELLELSLLRLRGSHQLSFFFCHKSPFSQSLQVMGKTDHFEER